MQSIVKLGGCEGIAGLVPLPLPNFTRNVDQGVDFSDGPSIVKVLACLLNDGDPIIGHN